MPDCVQRFAAPVRRSSRTRSPRRNAARRGFVRQRKSDDAAPLRERVDRRLHPLPSSLDAGNDDDRSPGAAVDDVHNRRTNRAPMPPSSASGFPVFSVCWMRSCVLRSPTRLRNASRSRSSRCCSVTVDGCGSDSARHDRRELPADQRVVIADAARAPGEVNAELQRREHRVAADGNRRARRRRLVALRDALQRVRLCIGDQPLAIHRDGVRPDGDSRGAARPARSPRPSQTRWLRRRAGSDGRKSVEPGGICSAARATISLVPPPAGISPTPASTRPM